MKYFFTFLLLFFLPPRFFAQNIQEFLFTPTDESLFIPAATEKKGNYISLAFHEPAIQAQIQEEELKNNEWYVHKVVRDGVEYLAPVNEERENFLQPVSFNFSSFHNYFFGYYCYSYGLEEIAFFENNSFKSSYWTTFPLFECQNADNMVFSGKYMSVMLYQETDLLFHYDISDINASTKQLILTNGNGDKGYFYTSVLSVNAPKFKEVNIYPNPVSDRLVVNMAAVVSGNYRYQLYDSTGKNVLTFQNTAGTEVVLDVKRLAAGVYWLRISEEGRENEQYFRKIIKK